jgi:hypothetical protein
MKSNSRFYAPLREYLATVPIVDCHDHTLECPPKPTNPLAAILDGYIRSDIESAMDPKVARDVTDLLDKLPLEEVWAIIEPAWKRTKYTGYGLVVRKALKEFYGEDDLTLEALHRMNSRLIDLSDEAVFDGILEKAKIVVRLEDSWVNMKDFINGKVKLPPRGKVVISLPGLHAIKTVAEVQSIGDIVNCTVTNLCEYLEACRAIFSGMKRAGAVAFKDQSAYERTLEYGNPTFAQAEEIFNWMMEDPRRSLAYPDGNKPLDDFLFHEFMRMARDLDLPVQIHTGHMAGIRNEITKTNAVGLTRLLELHRETRFDLFHANWPYGGEILFLVKNYPNVSLDFCWVHMIDPLYSQSLMKQAVSSVPHGKIHGYGSDMGGHSLTNAWAHAELARDNIAMALADLVDIDYLGMDDAREIARNWLFDNPNQFFKLGL